MIRGRRFDLIAAVVVASITAAVLWPLTGAAFLNWDDDAIFLRNPPLTDGRLISWAFTTTHMGHYQPLSWMAWAGVARTFGVRPEPFHVLNIATHALAAALVFALIVRLLSLAGVSTARSRGAAVVGALVFGIHPMRVEPVAWASAFPYLAALVFALLSVLAYLASRSLAWRSSAALAPTRLSRRPTLRAVAWSVAAIACFALSLGFRPIAVGLPLILLVIDWYPLHAAHQDAGRHRAAPLVADKLPYVLIAIAATGLEWFARRQVGFNDISTGARVTLAATAPLLYLWRTVAPFGLSPVSVLPLDAQGSATGAVCAVAIGATMVAGWRLRHHRPSAMAIGLAYLLLVAPTAGLAPTGLQAVADRYAYMPAVAIAVAVAAAVAWMRPALSRRPYVIDAAAVAVLTALSVLTWRQTAVWQNSIALWTQAAQRDPANDVAFYNLGSALQDAGRSDEAAAAYESVLRLVPDHAPARQNLNGLRAIARQRDADALAGSGELAAAIPLYRDVLTLDPRRARARAALGVALVQTGRFAEAAQELMRAIDDGIDDPAVFNAAGFALVQTGRPGDAVRLLQHAVERHPDDPGMRRNLQLLRERTERKELTEKK